MPEIQDIKYYYITLSTNEALILRSLLKRAQATNAHELYLKITEDQKNLLSWFEYHLPGYKEEKEENEGEWFDEEHEKLQLENSSSESPLPEYSETPPGFKLGLT